MKINFNIHKRAYSQSIDDADKILLKNIYKPYNERLFKFLGYEIEEWK